MSFGKINKIMKFIDKYIKINQLEKITNDDFLEVTNNLFKEGKEHFPDLTFQIMSDLLSKKYKMKYIFTENSDGAFPEYPFLYPNVEIPPEYQYLEDQFQKLKALPQPEQRTKEWYEYRHNRITASDTAAAIDENPYEPVEGFILKKCDPDHQFLDNANVYHGKKFELIATKIYEHIYNTQVFEFGALPSATYPLLGASPDGIASCKTLNNKFSEKLGTMLEIKCVAPNGRTIETSGEIRGHICPYYYYLQVQQQLECCELEICDFWQCKLIHYKSREDYLVDKCLNTVHTFGTDGKKMKIDSKIKKGMLLQFFPFKWEAQFDGDEKEWKSKFIYPPRLDMTEKEYDEWFVRTMASFNTNEMAKDYYFHKIIYWKLEQSHNQPIERDRKLFARILPVMEQTWKRVEYYRNNLDKLGELKEIVERRKKYIRTVTDFTINTDIIKNKVLFLDTPNPVKVKAKPVAKNLKQTVDCDFNDDLPSQTSKPQTSKPEPKLPKKLKKNKKDESDKEDDTYKKVESVFSKKFEENDCEFID